MAAPRSLSFAEQLPFKYVGGDLSIDLVNTVDWSLRGPAEDRLTDYDRLTRWAEGAGVIASRQGAQLRALASSQPRIAERTHREAIELRWQLRELFTATERGERLDGSDALEAFNAALSETLSRLELAGRVSATRLGAVAGATCRGRAARVGGGGADPRMRGRGLRLDVRRPQPQRIAAVVPDGDVRESGKSAPAGEERRRLVPVRRLVVRRLAILEEQIVEPLLHASGNLAHLTGQIAHERDEHRAEVRAVACEDGRPLALAQQEREDGHVRLRAVARLTGEHEVVAAVVGALAAARCHVVERDGGLGDSLAAVGADGPMLREEPSPGLGVGGAAGRRRRQLWGGPSTSALAPAPAVG